MNSIHIKSSAASAIGLIAISEFPKECCGFFWGDKNAIRLAKEVKNNSFENKSESFRISDADYLSAEEFAEKNNVLLLGVFHSHPNQPALPSREDLDFAMPNFVNIIVSVGREGVREMRAWVLKEDEQQLTEIKIKIN
ncbi:M67 family metallopeptidase [Pedobacter sp. MC2016-05]|uniref:M67 family metallopeptidase n=1 Tax=Pedobacter sp. MC2016-05 TaxID=2994474 RepID=UPI0022477541|nr:M67 family metallopeptidase [Pedobacter sp. MC2016-05]MCX2473290.1 M67 family metallopeptidase [Pedobacter sp. MC2016-05]